MDLFVGVHHETAASRIVLNVGGTRFHTYPGVLKKIPATRMSRLTHALANYDAEKNEYYFDRHPGVFSQILNYYRTGKLHYPQCVCGPLFEEELVFWGIDANQVEPCCWKTYTNHRQTEETLMTLEKLNIDVTRTSDAELAIKFDLSQEPGYPDNLSKFKQLQPIIWQMFEEPRSSFYAKIIASTQIFAICLSVFSLWLQSYPMTAYNELMMEYQAIDEANIMNFANMTNMTNLTDSTIVKSSVIRLMANPVSWWLIAIDYLTLIWFITDFTIRYVCSPDKRLYLMKLDNLLDIFATLLLIVDIILNFYITSFFIHSFQVVRVLRLFRLLSYHPGLRVIILSVTKSAEVLNLLLLVLLILSILFGAFIFFAEKLATSDPNNNLFISIPDALWFSLVSLTTIGYGDISPVTFPGNKYIFSKNFLNSLISSLFQGRIIGAMCVITGVLMIGLPMTIVVEVFSNYYKHLGARGKMPKERRRITPVEAPRAKKKAAAANK